MIVTSEVLREKVMGKFREAATNAISVSIGALESTIKAEFIRAIDQAYARGVEHGFVLGVTAATEDVERAMKAAQEVNL